MKQLNNEKSFTLLELLIVIAVIAILAAIVIVSLSGAQQRAREARGMNFSQNIRTTLSNDLVGEWTFDDDTIYEEDGTWYTRDTSGNGNDGTIYGATPTEDGIVRGALEFDGNDYINIGNSDNLKISNLVTVSVWVKPASGAYGYVVAKDHYQQYALFVGEYGDVLRTYTMGINNPTAYDFPTNAWTHIVSTYNQPNGTLIHYINGNEVQKFSRSTIIDTNNLDLIMGKRCNPSGDCNSGAYYYKGLIDEVRIYNQSLTAYEVEQLYAESLPRHLSEK